MTPNYRADIDGLRAIAVLSVLCFHTGFEVFSGGYVGVDIFFVISGFLITTIIVREIGNNTFSITTFYERRFRRILPAAITVVSASLLIAHFLLGFKEYVNLARSSIANNLFASNIYFYLKTGYFDGPAELKPLLHTWSLSVEEQYYVFFPLLLLLIAKRGGGNYLHCLMPVFLLSFGASLLGMNMDESAVFYMLPTRAWELLIGSLLAIVALPKVQSITALNLISTLGLLMMLYSITTFTRETPFPSGYAAIPTFGAALVIYAGGSGTTLVNQFLAIRPIVFIGLISYSLYLWHWPLIVYAKLLKVVDLTMVDQFLLLAVIFIFSILSWFFIEIPFRKKKLLPGKRSMFAGSFASIVVLILGASSVLYADGFPERFNLKQSAEELAGDPEWNHWRVCEDLNTQLEEHKDLCSIGREGDEASFIFWGDSHARALASAVHASADRNGATGVVASHSACPPLQGIERTGRLDCLEFNKTILDYISQHPKISTVIMAARWALSAKGTRYKHEIGQPVELVDISPHGKKLSGNVKLLEVGLRRTIRSLQDMGKSVVLVMPVPEIGYNVPSANLSALLTGRDVNLMIAPSLTEYLNRIEEVLAVFSHLERDLSVRALDPAAFLCDDKYCRVAHKDGISFYRDDDHLSTFGSKYVSRVFDHLFIGALSTQNLRNSSAIDR